MTAAISYDEVRAQLNKLNISFDIQTISDIYCFIKEFIGSLCDTNPKLHIPAAAAIICQSKKIPKVGGQGFTTTGIKVENIMRGLTRGVSKEEYLQIVQVQIKKWEGPDHILGEKINKLNISFRIFKKYKTIFQQLSKYTRLSLDLASTQLEFFWLLFLLIKHQKGIVENINQSIKTLLIVFEEAFSSYIGNLQSLQINECVLRKDNFPAIPCISAAQKIQTKEILHKLVQEVIMRRSHLSTPDYSIIFKDPIKMKRLVDDLSYQYQIAYNSLPEGHYVDQMTYLELTKDLTPQVNKNYMQVQTPISKIIDFEMEEQSIQFQNTNNQYQENTEIKLPTFSELPVINSPKGLLKIQRKISFGNNFMNEKSNSSPPVNHNNQTPVRLSMARQQWAKQYFKDFSQAKLYTMRAVMQSRGVNSQNFQFFCKEKIRTQIRQFTPQLQQIAKEEQETNTIRFFGNIIVDLSTKEDFEILLESEINFDEVLCCASCIYSAIIKNQNIEFKSYCLIYGINIIQGAKMLFFLGQKLDFPQFILDALNELEKQILIKDIWDSKDGFNLLKQSKQASNQIIMNRLYRHIYGRITEICQKMQIQGALYKKIDQLVKSIMKQKPELLDKNKMDQIIVCSITACLDLNKTKHSRALNTIFHYYNTASFSVNNNSERLYCKEGNQINLMQFYNQFFMLEVENLLRGQSNVQFLLTPIKNQHLNNKKSPLTFPPISKFSRLANNNQLTDYRRSIAQKLVGLAKPRETPQEEVESPTFRQLKRSVTFGHSSP